MIDSQFLNCFALEIDNQPNKKAFYYEVSCFNQIQQLPMLNVKKLQETRRISQDDQSDLYLASYNIGYYSIPVFLRKTRIQNVSKKLKKLIFIESHRNLYFLNKNYGCSQNQTQFWYATQFMSQGSLDQFISFHSRKKMPKLKQTILAQICYKILKGIEQLYQYGIKSQFLLCPENIGFNSKGELKLMNLQINENLYRYIRKSDYYLSPEQIQGQQHQQTCHTWALGLILYQLATNSQSLNKIVSKKMNSKQKQTPMTQILHIMKLNVQQKLTQIKQDCERSSMVLKLIYSLQRKQEERAKIGELLSHSWLLTNKSGNQLKSFLKFLNKEKAKK